MACSKVVRGSTEVRTDALGDATIVCDNVVEIASSHHRSPGSTTGESQKRAAKQVPIWRYVTVSQEAKLFNCDIVSPG